MLVNETWLSPHLDRTLYSSQQLLVLSGTCSSEQLWSLSFMKLQRKSASRVLGNQETLGRVPSLAGCGSDGKESAYNAGDIGLTYGSGRSPEPITENSQSGPSWSSLRAQRAPGGSRRDGRWAITEWSALLGSAGSQESTCAVRWHLKLIC